MTAACCRGVVLIDTCARVVLPLEVHVDDDFSVAGKDRLKRGRTSGNPTIVKRIASHAVGGVEPRSHWMYLGEYSNASTWSCVTVFNAGSAFQASNPASGMVFLMASISVWLL